MISNKTKHNKYSQDWQDNLKWLANALPETDKTQLNQARAVLTQWISEGKIKNIDTIEYGIENAPQALIGLFHGKNIGKQLIQV